MAKIFWQSKRFWLCICLCLGCIYLICLRPVQIILQTAPNTHRSVTAEPEFNYKTLTAWEADKTHIQQQFENALYGTFPDILTLEEIKRIKPATAYFNDKGQVEIRLYKISGIATYR